ncbi:MAG: DNA mismatch repair protein MutS [Gilvibacter sp.]
MSAIHKKTLEDLEFPAVLAQIAEGCITDLGKESVLLIVPYKSLTACEASLLKTTEMQASFNSDNRIPNHGFDAITRELHLLGIENSSLEISGFRRIKAIGQAVHDIQKFLKKYQEFYQQLSDMAELIPFESKIVKEIEGIVDIHGQIKDDASSLLKEIRTDLKRVKSKIGSSFTHALKQALASDHLDEIKESIVDGTRVLAVKAMHRRKVKGRVLGSSKTGSIVYIQPQATLEYANELSNLIYDQDQEVKKILSELTEFMRPFGETLAAQQEYLVAMDVLYGKAKYANTINAVVPRRSKTKVVQLIKAYHPLLLVANKARRQKTIPQDIGLHPEKRIIVISGPNAGGKSITLKTVGLLQLMFQAGIPIPAEPTSELSFFDKILTDIGDNQSIENHLSTYSYRLKKMNQFLKRCNENSLFLIDEFGTGSDPELGGALAETFLEVFYERDAFGIITTHYTNLKLLAGELPHAVNANMQFDNRSLEPLYTLFMGEAGSSYTFEVAQKNGIPYGLINRAKKKIARGKVRFDKTIANLQKERSKLRQTSESLKTEEQKAREEGRHLEETQAKVQDKLERYQELYDSQQRLIQLGRKLDTLALNYANNKRKKQLVDDVLKIVAVENSKRKPKEKAPKKEQKAKAHILKQEVEQEIAVIRRKKKKAKKEAEKKEPEKPKVPLKVGDRVRLLDGKAVGTIDSIEKEKAVVNYGIFTTKAHISQLELVS